MKTLSFYKTEQNEWFLDAPEYIEHGGAPEELQMVLGADILLDTLADGKDGVRLEVSQEKTQWVNVLRRVDEIPTQVGKYYHDDQTETLLWLCPVTTWVFNGVYPETIWYKKL